MTSGLGDLQRNCGPLIWEEFCDTALQISGYPSLSEGGKRQQRCAIGHCHHVPATIPQRAGKGESGRLPASPPRSVKGGAPSAGFQPECHVR